MTITVLPHCPLEEAAQIAVWATAVRIGVRMERHLAAIVSADVVGYSLRMREDEVGTLAALKEIRSKIVIPKTRQYRGRSIKLLGDGEMFEFQSIVDAICFAVDVQLALEARNRNPQTKKQLHVRFGINIGDVIVEGNDIFGDGVNLAARIEAICPPGGICLSDGARFQIVSQVDLDFEDLGLKELKGFDKPVNVYSVVMNEKAEALRALAPQKVVEKRPAAPGIWEKPAIKIAAALGMLYIGIGAIQYVSQGNQITKASVFCPIVKMGSSRDATVKIGALMPFEESFGKRQRWGIQQALNDRRDLFEYPVQLLLRDSKGDLEETRKHLANFGVEGVAAVLGPMQSRLAYDAKKWANENQIPVITSLASASYLTGRNVRDFFFRVGMSDRGRANAMVEWLRAKNLHNNPYILHEWAAPTPGEDEPDIYGASQAAAIKEEIGNATTLRFTRHDKPSQLEAIEQVKNDGRAIMIFSYTSNIKYIIGELQNRGIENPIFLMGVITTELEKANYPMPDKLHVVTGLVSEAKNLATTERLRREFEDANPDIPYDLSAYYAYDSVNMLMDAINLARDESCSGVSSGVAIAKNLRNSPTKKRKIINAGFLPDAQEILFEYDGLRIIDGRFEHVGLGAD